MQRCAGILLPISALPAPYGIGTLGRAAYDFIDFLHHAGQRVWQMLPAGPTGYADSPYQSVSAFAGNPYFIDPDLLKNDGLLTDEEIGGGWGINPRAVDYGAVYARRPDILRIACRRVLAREPDALDAFRAENAHWLPDYALFMALKWHYGMRPWMKWPNRALVNRAPDALARYRKRLSEDILFFETVQMLFFRQWDALKRYAGARNIRLMGDVPIYTAMDSADVWAHPENYQLDSRGRPTGVAGVPPDYFSRDGQLWGNPLYNWAHMRHSGYSWWIQRLKCAARLYDILRIDHFRGFAGYWRVPYGHRTARDGRWVKGPGLDFTSAVFSQVPELEIVAEDLGVLTPAVRTLLEKTGLPGMKVLEFAFSGKNNPYLPHLYSENCICYTGTHDNPPVRGWALDEPDCAQKARRYCGADDTQPLSQVLIAAGLGSRAKLFIAQMQDWLDLGADCRMNTPGTTEGNWTWRLLPGEADDALAGRIFRLTDAAGRVSS